MAEHEVGILLKVKDAASKVLGKTKKAAEGVTDALGDTEDAAEDAGKEIEDLGQGGRSSMETLAIGVTAVNQSVELFKAGLDFAKTAIVETIKMSAEFAEEGSKMREWAQDFGDSTERLMARVGEVFIPIIQGFGDEVSGATGGMAGWIKENRKFLASGIVDFFEAMSVAIKPIATGIGVLINAFKSLRITGNAVLMGLIKPFELLTRAMGKTDIADNLQAAMDDMTGDMVKTGEEMIEVAQKADQMGESIKTAFDKGVKKSRELIAVSKAGGDIMTTRLKERADFEKAKQDELKAKADEVAAKKEEFATRVTERAFTEIQRQRDMEVKLQEDILRAQDEAMTARQEKAEEVGGMLAETMGTAFGSIIDGSKSVSDAFGDMAKEVIKNIIKMTIQNITANAASAASGAAASQASIPGIGPILAASAMAAMQGMVLGLLDSFAGGGEVMGGTPGRDSVGALLTPGERVLTVEENAMFKRLSRSVAQPRPAGNSSGMVALAGGGEVQAATAASGSVVVNFNPTIQMLDPPDSAKQRRLLLGLGQTLDSLVKDRLILTSLARA